MRKRRRKRTEKGRDLGKKRRGREDRKRRR
jgi:hypothetical protein